MDNPFPNIDVFILGNILGCCDVVDIERMKWIDW
jgi:hypothetical protein